MASVSGEAGDLKRQGRILAVILLPVIGLIVLGYFWFLRGDYAVLAQDLRPEEAAAIVEQLKQEDVAYRLQDSGRAILVPSGELDAIRLDLSGKELPLKGTVGFELFNESDMGLTDFAQKVNYQRALQGEIARTIMAMDGIASARVHLALPERSLFRANRSEPKAAVTVTPRANVMIDADRIAGVQRLVAAAVPDLKIEQVTVLNERGQLLTPAYDDSLSGMDRPASALERAYAERAGAAIASRFPSFAFDLKVTTIPNDPSSGSPAASVSTRDHGIRIVAFTRAPISPPQEQELRRVISAELGLDPAQGDELRFSRVPEMAPPAAVLPNSQPVAAEGVPVSGLADRLFAHWLLAMAAIGGIGLLLVYWRARRRKVESYDQLAAKIREQLKLTQVSADAAG